ncbi:MAG TPA: DUF4349 domain-containing protein [Microbacterium sp.]|nr:DUF4349 domain-containing protein [Microbacterium sp.]
MNTEPRTDATQPPELPALTDERIDEIENSLFTEIARDRTTQRARRSRGWVVGGAAAAVIVVAAVLAPSVGTFVGGAGSNESAVAPNAPAPAVGEGGADSGVTSEGKSMTDLDRTEGLSTAEDSPTADRAIITTASATVLVDDISAAADMIADAAASRDGYVESMSIGQSGQVVPVDPSGGIVYDSTMPYPVDGAWITVRVPADGLQSLVDQLSGLGEVTSSSVNRQDVTEVTLDLQARVAAAQASVDRLTELMSQAGSLADLIAAESALAERQATLESYQQQLKYYDEQVAMSTLTVTLTEPTETVEANPAGFGDGLAAGWNALVAAVNGIVIAIGFLLPWLLIVLVAGLVVWGIVRLVRRRRSAPKTPAAAPAERTETDAQV